MSLLNLVRKPSTLNGKAPYFEMASLLSCLGTSNFPCFPLGSGYVPIESTSRLGDRTASPTLNWCGLFPFFCHMAGTLNPMAHPFCAQVKAALLRKLCLVEAKKFPLLQCQLLHTGHPSQKSGSSSHPPCSFDMFSYGPDV